MFKRNDKVQRNLERHGSLRWGEVIPESDYNKMKQDVSRVK